MNNSQKRRQRRIEKKEIEAQVPGVDVPPVDPRLNEMIENNVWHDLSHLDRVVGLVHGLTEEDSGWKWYLSHHCKYINIKIDMRDGGFVVTNQEGERIDREQLQWQYKSGESK